MASSFYSNAQHVDFESVLSMDDHGMVSMFEALMASGLRGFLGCPAVVYEDALVDFFENASVRSGVIISTVGGQLVEILEDGLQNLLSFLIKMNWDKFLFSILKKMVSPGSKQAKGFAIQISLLLATFPSLELGESSEFPASKVLTKKTVHRFVSIHDRDGADEVTGAAKKKVASKKRPAADVGAAVPKKKRTFKKKSISSISSLELVEVAEEAIPIQQVAEPLDVEEPRCSSADAVDLIIQQVIDEVAKFFHSFSLRKLASINLEDMYKKEEQVLHWGETESPQVAIQRKFYILLKYRTVLVWKFLEAWRANFVPVQGSSAVDIQVIELLSDLYLSFLEELAKEALAHNLIWNKPCCSKIFEGSPRDRGAVIARTNSNTRSTCWIRKMILVDGLWTVELCADNWVKIPRKKRWADVCLEVTDFCAYRRLLPVGSINFCRALEIVETDSCFASRQPTVFSLRLSQFFTIHIQYSLFSSLSTADISDFLSSIALDRTVLRSVQSFQNSSSVAPSVQLSLEQQQSSSSSSSSSSSLHFDKTDVDATASSVPPISQDLSAAFADLQANLLEQIWIEQFCAVYRVFQNSSSVAPSVQLSLEQQQSSSSSSSSSSSLHFDKTDVDATASSVPPISQDLSAAFADLQANLLEQIFEYQSGLSSKLHKIEQSVQDAIGQSVVAGVYLSTVAKSAVGVFERSAIGMLSVVVLSSERFSRYFLEEQSADVVVSTSEYRFEFSVFCYGLVNDSVLIS
ncbi:ataxin-3 [Dorcoceras hygrometricum]|uniref:Ataxin-3 n=1 Tax=Dorcoceras hygrometricum TaxID=472368 RepID=A0A2Z7BQG4_9LAMI|nr:ataxin-3 [Dorcoceras hygrometricum]